MKHRIPTIIITVILLLTVAIGVSASTGDVIAKLSYNNIRVTLDDSPVELRDSNGESVEPFIIDGTTYLPVRAVAEALGLDVDWDGTTNTVVLTSITNDKETPNNEKQTDAEPGSLHFPFLESIMKPDEEDGFEPETVEPISTPVPTPIPTQAPVPTSTPTSTSTQTLIHGRDPSATVYVSNASNTIHSVHNCSGMKNYRTMTLAEANSRGYKYCPKCW